MFLISQDMAPRASQPVAGPFRCVPDIVCGRTKCAAKGRIRSDTYTGEGSRSESQSEAYETASQYLRRLPKSVSTPIADAPAA